MDGVTNEESRRRFEPLNCISWILGHLANQEHSYWVLWAQDKNLAPELQELVGYGKPASTPPLEEMWETWHTITAAADEFLATVATRQLETFLEWRGKPVRENIGTLLLRNRYHNTFCWELVREVFLVS